MIDKFLLLLYSKPVPGGGVPDNPRHTYPAYDGLARQRDQVAHDRESVVIQHRGEKEIMMITATE